MRPSPRLRLGSDEGVRGAGRRPFGCSTRVKPTTLLIAFSTLVFGVIAQDKVSVIAGQNEVAELICRNDVTSRRRLNVD